jgi:hypothetical protein
MKKLLILLFSIFFLSSPSVFADDISDFEIEGMSIGDSLLDYLSEDEILKEIELNKDDYSYLNEPNKYVEIYFWEKLSSYDNGLSVFIKNTGANQFITNKNEKYKILSIYGMMHFTEDFDGCKVKRDEIVEKLSMMFPNSQKRKNSFSAQSDTSGNSIVDAVYFHVDSRDDIEVSCTNYEETFRIKNNWSEGLSVAIRTEEIVSWLENR